MAVVVHVAKDNLFKGSTGFLSGSLRKQQQTKLINMKIVKVLAITLAAAGVAVSASCGSASAPAEVAPIVQNVK